MLSSADVRSTRWLEGLHGGAAIVIDGRELSEYAMSSWYATESGCAGSDSGASAKASRSFFSSRGPDHWAGDSNEDEADEAFGLCFFRRSTLKTFISLGGVENSRFQRLGRLG